MIFVDTWAWIALSDDQYSASAQKQHAAFMAQRAEYVTSDFVLTELINYLYTSFAPSRAQAAVELLFEQVATGRLRLVHVSSD
jgi:predicted nucleic acid-binding protein